MGTASKLLAEQYQSVLEEIQPAVSEAVFARLNESIRRHQELLDRLQRENKLLRELRRLDLLEKYGPSAETLSPAERPTHGWRRAPGQKPNQLTNTGEQLRTYTEAIENLHRGNGTAAISLLLFIGVYLQ